MTWRSPVSSVPNLRDSETLQIWSVRHVSPNKRRRIRWRNEWFNYRKRWSTRLCLCSHLRSHGTREWSKNYTPDFDRIELKQIIAAQDTLEKLLTVGDADKAVKKLFVNVRIVLSPIMRFILLWVVHITSFTFRKGTLVLRFFLYELFRLPLRPKKIDSYFSLDFKTMLTKP